MREIKFRGKILEGKDKGKWVYGYYIKDLGSDHWIESEDDVGRLVDPETVGQFAGLQDRNGEEIWEDDIVKNEYEKKPAVVKFGTGHQGEPADGMYPYWGWYTEGWIDRFAFNGDDLEIIGNVHDNPDLPEEKDEDL